MKKERFDRGRLADRIGTQLNEIDHEERPTIEDVLKRWKFEHPFEAYPAVVKVAIQGIQVFSFYDYGQHMYYVSIPDLTVDELSAVDALGVEIMTGVLNVRGIYRDWLNDQRQGSPEEKAIQAALHSERYSSLEAFKEEREALIQKRMEEIKEEFEEEYFEGFRQRLDQVAEDGLIRLSNNRGAFLTPGLVEAIREADL